LFDDVTLHRIRKNERMLNKRFDFVLVSKTLHHLRTEKCIVNEREKKHKKKHKCSEDEKCCIYGFEEREIFEKLFELGKRVIVYEWFDPNEEDEDKVRGRGGYLTRNEWNKIFKHLCAKYKVELTRPNLFHLNEKTPNEVDSILRKIDYVCFYVEEQG